MADLGSPKPSPGELGKESHSNRNRGPCSSPVTPNALTGRAGAAVRVGLDEDVTRGSSRPPLSLVPPHHSVPREARARPACHDQTPLEPGATWLLGGKGTRQRPVRFVLPQPSPAVRETAECRGLGRAAPRDAASRPGPAPSGPRTLLSLIVVPLCVTWG